MAGVFGRLLADDKNIEVPAQSHQFIYRTAGEDISPTWPLSGFTGDNPGDAPPTRKIDKLFAYFGASQGDGFRPQLLCQP